MPHYEYRVVPTPKSLVRAKGVRDPDMRLGLTLEQALNDEGRQGWEFQRVETVTTEIRRGFLSRSRPETFSVMVFRRLVEADRADPAATADPEARQRRSPSPGIATRPDAEPVLRPLGAADRR